MIERDTLLAFLDDALAAESRAQFEARLAEDQEALRFVAAERQMDRLLHSRLRPESAKQRVKQSILAAVRAVAPAQLKAGVMAETADRARVERPRSVVQVWKDFLAEAYSAVESLAGAARGFFAGSSLRRFATAAAAIVLAVGVGFYFYERSRPVPGIEIGKFAAVTGSPTLRHAGEHSTLNAQPSTAIRLGDRIETGDADKADLQFNDGTTVRLNFNTAIEIPGSTIQQSNNPTIQRPSDIKLLLGHVWAKVQKITNAPQFAVQTPVATATVKGTEFGLKLRKSSLPKPGTQNPQLGANLLATLTVKDGTVEFSNVHGKVDATAMTESVAEADTAPTAPTPVRTLKTFRLTRSYLALRLPSVNIFQDAADALVYPIGWIGISLASVPPSLPATNTLQVAVSNILRISQVRRGSPAELAGAQAGDAISAINGESVTNTWQVRRAILAGPNRPITLNLLRGGDQKIISLATATLPYALLNLPPMPDVPVAVQAPLYEATWRLIVAGNEQQITPGQITEGERALKELLTRHPDIAALHYNLGFLHNAKGDGIEAIRDFRRAVELDPGIPRYRYMFGLELRALGNFERAVEELEEAVRLAPAWPAATRWLSDVYTLVERYEDATNAVEACLRLNPLDAELWRQKAEVLLRGRQPEAALPAVLKAIELEPSLAILHIVLGNVYHDLGREEESEAAQRKAIELGPPDNSAHVNLANRLRSRGRLDEAEALYRKALEMDPDTPAAFTGLGIIFAERGKLPDAEKPFRKAVELDPNSTTYWSNLGDTLRELNKLDEAEQCLHRAIELDPEYASAYANLGLLYSTRQQWTQAEQMFLKAGKLDPRLPIASDLARVYKSQGKLDQAEETLRRWVERNTKDPIACNALAWHLAERAIKLDEALALATRAVELPPNHPDLPNNLDTLGWVHFQRGELDEAAKVLQRALALAGESPTAAGLREHLKKVQEKKGTTQP